MPFEAPCFKKYWKIWYVLFVFFYKRYVLFVDSYSEKDFLKIFAFFYLKNVDNVDNFLFIIFRQWVLNPKWNGEIWNMKYYYVSCEIKLVPTWIYLLLVLD